MSKQQREAALQAARTIAETAKSAGRDLTADETKAIEGHLAEVDRIDAASKSASIMDHPAFKTDERASTGNYLGTKTATAESIAAAMSKAGGNGPTYGQKALIVAGDVYADVPLLTSDPFAQPRPPANIIDALPVGIIDAPTFTYLRQTTRTNNAAPVAVGGTKPTSTYGLTPVDGKLHVIAHISEPFDEYWVEDSPALKRFLEAEMVYGLYQAVQNQVLNGDGTGANLTGLANTSGIQTQAWATDLFLTTRKALTSVETLGYTPRMYVMNPTDWETIETSAFTSGNYILNAEGRGNLPVDAAARRLWGVPVVLSTAQAAGAGYLISAGAVELVSDGKVKTKVSDAHADDFDKNQLRMRVESRFELAVPNPSGVVSIDLSAA